MFSIINGTLLKCISDTTHTSIHKTPLPLSLSLSISLSVTHPLHDSLSHSQPLTLNLSLTPRLSLSLSTSHSLHDSLSLTLNLSLTPRLSLSLSTSHSLHDSLSHSQPLTPPLSLSLSTLNLSLRHSLSHSQPLTHSMTLTLNLSLRHSLSLSLFWNSQSEDAWHERGLQQQLLHGRTQGLVEGGGSGDHSLLHVVQPGEVGLHVPQPVGGGGAVCSAAPTGIVHTEGEEGEERITSPLPPSVINITCIPGLHVVR